MKIINLNLLKNKKKSTQEIIEGCQKGNAQCQEILFKRYAASIMTVCRRYEHPSFGASDILQEAFILIFKNIKQFDATKGSIETWMKKIAVNTALKVIRKRKIQFLDIESSEFRIGESAEEPIDVEVISEEVLLKNIQELPEGYRTIFNLFVIEGYTHQEIASLVGITTQTSKSQLSKAKKALRKKLSSIDANRRKRKTNTNNY